MSINRWTDCGTYELWNMTQLQDRAHLSQWRDLEPIAQGEVSRKEKDKCRAFRLGRAESRKMGRMGLFAGQQGRRRRREQDCGPGG